MIALIQRVSQAKIEIDQCISGQINTGLLVLLGIQKDDTQAKADALLHKVLHYRIFADANDKMNLNVQQAQGSLLIASQFTLTANTHKGLRPSFDGAPPDQAINLYDYFIAQAKEKINTATGKFGANMQITLTNDGPVTFWLET